MIIRRNIFEKYEKYRFNIPIKTGDRVLVDRGEKVRKGKEILKKKVSNIRKSFYVVEELGVSLNKIESHLKCIDGEFVNEGDILAERVIAGGLNVKKLVAPVQGVVDMSRLESGYLDILGEEEEVLLKSTFKGVVEDINPVNGVNFLSKAFALDILSISNNYFAENESRKIAGEFLVLGKGTDLLLKADDENEYTDKIVFTGKYLHPELLEDLFERGASFVLTYSMEYEYFSEQGLPVGVIGGFGEIYSNKKIMEALSEMNGAYTVVDYDENQIFFLEEVGNLLKQEQFVQMAVGSNVISRSLSNYGMLGKIVEEIEGDMYVKVQWESGQSSMVHVGSLEFVSL